MHVFEGSEIFHDSDVSLDLVERPSDSPVDAVFRDQDATPKGVCFAQRALPQTDRLRISKWREFVKEDDLLRSDVENFNRGDLRPLLRFSGLWFILIRVCSHAQAWMF